MKQRCYNEFNAAYPNYGGRGVTVCDQWRDDYDAFETDMGPRPDGCSLDRINCHGNYEPDNCRWATREEQNNNRRIPRVSNDDDMRYIMKRKRGTYRLQIKVSPDVAVSTTYETLNEAKDARAQLECERDLLRKVGIKLKSYDEFVFDDTDKLIEEENELPEIPPFPTIYK